MTLNIANIRKLADHMRNLPDERAYNQEIFLAPAGHIISRDPSFDDFKCEAVGCLAGHACILALGGAAKAFASQERSSLDVEGKAREWLGLDWYSAGWLFSGDAARHWPEEFRNRLMTGEEKPSAVAADLLDAIAAGKVLDLPVEPDDDDLEDEEDDDPDA